MKKQPPIFLHDPRVYEIFQDIAACVPNGTKFYIVGGAMRNAMFYYYFDKKLPQRDYDSIIIGDHKKFIANLRKHGFAYGRIRRKTQAVLKRAKTKGMSGDDLNEFVFLDMRWEKKGNILQNLKEHTAFTMGGFGIEVHDLFAKNWISKVTKMPHAVSDLKAKKLVVNAVDNKHNLFAALRFMSVGFKQPSKSDVEWLLREFKIASKRRRKKNLKKLYNYVGGEKKAVKLAKKIGVDLKALLSS